MYQFFGSCWIELYRIQVGSHDIPESSSEILEQVNVENDLIRKETSLGATQIPLNHDERTKSRRLRHPESRNIFANDVEYLFFYPLLRLINRQSIGFSQARSGWADPISLPSQAIHIVRKRPQTLGVMQQSHEVFILLSWG